MVLRHTQHTVSQAKRGEIISFRSSHILRINSIQGSIKRKSKCVTEEREKYVYPTRSDTEFGTEVEMLHVRDPCDIVVSASWTLLTAQHCIFSPHPVKLFSPIDTTRAGCNKKVEWWTSRKRGKAGEKQREIIKLFCQESWLLCELVCEFFSGHESDWIFHIPKWLCGDPWQQQQRDEEAALGAHLKNWKISLFPLALTHFNRIWESEHKKLFRIQKFFHYRLWNDILYSFSFSFRAKRPECQF